MWSAANASWQHSSNCSGAADAFAGFGFAAAQQSGSELASAAFTARVDWPLRFAYNIGVNTTLHLQYETAHGWLSIWSSTGFPGWSTTSLWVPASARALRFLTDAGEGETGNAAIDEIVQTEMCGNFRCPYGYINRPEAANQAAGTAELCCQDGSARWNEVITVGSPPEITQHSAALDGEAQIWLYGGEVQDTSGTFTKNFPSANLWKFDLQDTSWTLASVGPQARAKHSAAIHGSIMLIYGGWQQELPRHPTELLRYDILTNTWTRISPRIAPPGRQEHTPIFDGHGRMWVYGGRVDYLDKPEEFSYNMYLDDVWYIDGATLIWTQVTNTVSVTGGPALRCGHVAGIASKHSDRMWVYGGRGSLHSLRSDLWILDLKSFAWTELDHGNGDSAVPAGSAPSALWNYAATASEGQMCLWGGGGYGRVFGWMPNMHLWCLDIEARTWKLIPQRPGFADKSYIAQEHAVLMDRLGRLWTVGGADVSADPYQLEYKWEYIPIRATFSLATKPIPDCPAGFYAPLVEATVDLLVLKL